MARSSLEACDELRRSILNRAFAGQLAPQDPNDEPASALLERIKSERAVREAEAKATKTSRRGPANKPRAACAGL